jgi:CRP-like cAMP-binding protein
LEFCVPSDPIPAALVRRLQTSAGISEEEIKEIHALPITVKDFPAERAVVRDGERATESCLIVEGFCMRSKTIADGKRQILSLHIPGEIPDLMSLFLHVMDHDLSTLTPCRLGFIQHETLQKLHRRRPNLAEIFWRDTLIDAAMFREWIVNVGQRPAPARLAHVIVELRERLKVIGRVTGDSFEMPLTQEQIGEALGVTAVHANRVIKQLRQEGIVEFHRGRVTVLSDSKLLELADFDDRYLHQSPAL